MKQNTFTAPQAFITIDNQIAGYVRTISFAENLQRVDVRGLGSLYPQESPATSSSCTFSIGQFFLDFQQPVMKALLNRTGGAEALKNTLTTGEISFSVNIYKKTVKNQDPTAKLVTSIVKDGQEIAILRDCFIDSQNWTLSEGAISSTDVTGRYLEPVSFND